MRDLLSAATTAFYREVVIRGFEGGYKRRPLFRYWNALEESQWLGRAALEEIQFDALKRLVAHAEQNCPYFRDAWRERGLFAADLKSPGDFARWPVLTREAIVHHRAKMRATAPPMTLIAKATGGSSGEPLHFDLDTDSHDRRRAATLRGYRWAGAGPGTKQFHLWGVPLGAASAWRRRKLELYDALYRRKVVNSFELSEARIPDVLKQLRSFRPDVVVAYTNPLYAFSRVMLEQALRPPPIRAIVVGAEKLHDFQRRTIEAAFDAPVFETYGSREFMLTASECERHEGLHLTFEQLLVEVLDDAGQPVPVGTEGNVVITDLHNYGMPFIRYLTGDRAVSGFGACSCGRGLPTLRKVVGRTLDLVTTPDGRQVPGEFFPHLIKDYAAVRQFQVVQDRPDEVCLSLVLSRPDDSALDSIRREIGDRLGPGVRLRVEIVRDLQLTRAGKLQVVVNRLRGSAVRERQGEGEAP